MADIKDTLKQLAIQIRDERQKGANTALRVGSLLLAMIETLSDDASLDKKFLRKDKSDTAREKISFEKGIQIMKNFVPGIIGGLGGAIGIDENGKVVIETDKAVFREEMIVPKITFNCIDVISGDKANTFAFGTIKSVDIVNRIATLDLLDDQWGTLHVSDICRGIFHNIGGSNHSRDEYDPNGFLCYSGFATSYFTPVRIIENEEGAMTFEYALQAGTDVHPMPGMNFFAYGNFTDKNRQGITYENRYYTRRLAHVNTWTIDPETNIMMQTGDLTGLSVGGVDFSGYSFYGKNVYLTGTIERLKPNGQPVKELNYEGLWESGRHYDYYDSVTHNGSTWACLNKNGSSAEPGTNSDWQQIASKGEDGQPGKDGISITNVGQWHTDLLTPKMGVTSMGGTVFLAKMATRNPPLWCWTDNIGNRFVFNEGGYLLTGEKNTVEYDEMVQSGKDGRDGKDHEFIFTNTITNTRPSTPATSQVDDYVPPGWNDDPVGVSASIPYEWASKRTKREGVWSDFSTPELWANHSFNAVSADLDNQMDNAALDENGTTVDAVSITTTASMWNGVKKLALSSISVQGVTGVTSSYDLSTGVITLSVAKGTALAGRTEISITVKAMVDGVEQSRVLKFILAGVRGGKDAVLYSLVTSASHIVKKKDGTYSVSGVSATRMKTVGGVSQVTADGMLKYAIDNGSEISVNNGASIPSSSISSKIIFSFYDAKGVLVDIESVPLIQDGMDGQGYTQVGAFKTGMVIPKMGVVFMGGGSYVSKVSTTNPPLWCWTDHAGNRLVYPDGGYLLTGEKNTVEYDAWAEKGEPGKDGTDGKPGADGKPGSDGKQGIQGCIIRHSEWNSGVVYRNDEALTSGTRYIDIAMIRNDAAFDGWDVYKCNVTHTSSTANKPGSSSSNWTKLSGVGPIFTSLILAKNASIDFVQGNELLIKDSSNNVVSGLTGGSGKEAGATSVRMWAGGSVPGSAPFRVDQYGNVVATKANISGVVNTTLLYSSGTDMDSLVDSGGNMTVNPSTHGAIFFSNDGLGGTITLPPASSWNGLKLEFVVDMASRVAKNPDKYKSTNYFCGLIGRYNEITEIQMERPYILEMRAFNNNWYVTRMDLMRE